MQNPRFKRSLREALTVGSLTSEANSEALKTVS